MITLGYGGDVDLAAPLEKHDLNEGRVQWLYGLPGLAGGPLWPDLCAQRPGTIVGSPTWEPTERGDTGLRLSGTGQYAEHAAPFTGATTSYTVAAWVRLQATGSQGVYSCRRKTAGSGILWQLDTGGGTIPRLIVRNDAGTTATASGVSSLTTGVPYRLVGVRANNDLTLYVNGVSVGTASAALGSTITAPDPCVGAIFANSATASQLLNGSISDVCVSARAWSLADVQADYDLGRRGYPGVLRRFRSPVSLLTGGTISPAVGTAALALGASASGSALATAAGSAGLTLTASAAGSKLATAAGSAGVALTASATGSVLASAAGAAGLSLLAEAVGGSLANAAGAAALSFTASAVGSSGSVTIGRVVNLCGHDRSVVSLPATDRSVVYLRASAEESTCRH